MPDPQYILCPYCGNAQQAPAQRCQDCNGFFDALSRQVTQQNMGPWFIRDTNHPFRPGCAYSVIANYITKGLIKPDTILRGPTTKQYWSVARNVPGVSHLLGFCHKCQKDIPINSTDCPHCQTPTLPAHDRETLGLAPLNPNLDQPQGVNDSTRPFPSPKPIANSNASTNPHYDTKSIILKKSTLPSPPPSSAHMSLAIDLNPNDAAAPPAITTLDHPITTNPTMPLPKPSRLSKLEWTFLGLNAALVVTIAALFLPTLLGNTSSTSKPITTPPPPQTQLPLPTPSATPTPSTPSTSPVNQTVTPAAAPEQTSLQQKPPVPSDHKLSLARLKSQLANLSPQAPADHRQSLLQQIGDLQKQIELESFFAP